MNLIFVHHPIAHRGCHLINMGGLNIMTELKHTLMEKLI